MIEHDETWLEEEAWEIAMEEEWEDALTERWEYDILVSRMKDYARRYAVLLFNHNATTDA